MCHKWKSFTAIIIKLTLESYFSIRVDSTKLENILEACCFLHHYLACRPVNLIWENISYQNQTLLDFTCTIVVNCSHIRTKYKICDLTLFYVKVWISYVPPVTTQAENYDSRLNARARQKTAVYIYDFLWFVLVWNKESR